ALARLAGEHDAPAKRQDELARDPEPEAEPAGAPARHGAFEAAEDARVVLGMDADAVVAHDQLGAGADGAHRDRDRLAVAILHRVADEVGHDLVDPEAIPATHHGGAGGDAERAADARQLVAETIAHLPHQRHELDLLEDHAE